MHQLVRGLVSILLGLFVGFSGAFILSPDPTGIFPIVAGLVLAIVLTVVFYVGMSRISSTEPE
ncbi:MULTISPECIES: hypothetical protein [Halarchaeum]|uniref:hypothetical protein n=1 Tax=Halarchaeum TaxID=744724 RepID=UPI00166A4A7A|nr:hypothetical protein [Halarchaeum grantii]